MNLNLNTIILTLLMKNIRLLSISLGVIITASLSVMRSLILRYIGFRSRLAVLVLAVGLSSGRKFKSKIAFLSIRELYMATRCVKSVNMSIFSEVNLN